MDRVFQIPKVFFLLCFSKDAESGTATTLCIEFSYFDFCVQTLNFPHHIKILIPKIPNLQTILNLEVSNFIPNLHYHTWSIVYTTRPHTHNTVWGLKLTCTFFSNLHYLLSWPRYVHVNENAQNSATKQNRCNLFA